MDNLDSLQLLTCAVEAARADIAPTYTEYLQLAMAIATDCGEAGRPFFHRLCALSPKYKQTHADKLFDNVLRTGRGRVHLGTAFHLAEQAGVDRVQGAEVQGASFSHAHARGEEAPAAQEEEEPLPDGEADELLMGSEPLYPLPCFPEAEWPEPVQKIRSFASSRPQADILTLGGLTVLGASMERHVRCPYGGRLLSPCLQTFIVAPPASGKGVLSLLRLLVEPVHDELRRQSDRAMEQYRKEKAAYDVKGKERAQLEAPQKPVNRMFLISGNNTGTGILQNLMDADGTGLILETEADTISTAIGSDYGHWSDTLRKAFDHERLSYNRRTDQEYREVRKSYLSVLLSGTPGQVKPLIPSAENGLFSRQLFYYMPGIRKWQNQFDPQDSDHEALFRAMGHEWKKWLDERKREGVFTLRLSEEQKAEFNRRFSALFERAGLTNGYEMNSSVARLAINVCRMLSVVAMLRGDKVPSADTAADNLKDGIITSWDLSVREADFQAVLGLIEPLYRHATHILSLLPTSEVSRRYSSERDGFFADLPESFTAKQLKELARERNLNENTVLSWLKRLKKRGSIRFAEGSYWKLFH